MLDLFLTPHGFGLRIVDEGIEFVDLTLEQAREFADELENRNKAVASRKDVTRESKPSVGGKVWYPGDGHGEVADDREQCPHQSGTAGIKPGPLPLNNRATRRGATTPPDLGVLAGRQAGI